MTLAASPILSNEHGTYPKDSFPKLNPTEMTSYIQHIRQEVIVPILEAEDPSEVLETKWEKFKELRDAIVQTQLENNDLLNRQNEIEDRLRSIFQGASEILGEKWVKPILSGLHLRRVVRETIFPAADEWPQDALSAIGDQLALNELCLACVLHHLKVGTGSVDNARTLGVWGYNFADYAYAEAGISGMHYVSSSGSEPG